MENSHFEDLAILAGLTILIFFVILPGKSPSLLDSIRAPSENERPGSVSITLGEGNAPSEYNPFKEYIVVRNTGTIAVDVTGWRLTGEISEARIPPGSRNVSLGGPLKSVVLEPGEIAFVVSGKMSPGLSYAFTEDLWWAFLGSNANVWRPEEETIRLYDRLGNLVDSLSY